MAEIIIRTEKGSITPPRIPHVRKYSDTTVEYKIDVPNQTVEKVVESVTSTKNPHDHSDISGCMTTVYRTIEKLEDNTDAKDLYNRLAKIIIKSQDGELI